MSPSMRSRPTPIVWTGTLYWRISASMSRPKRSELSEPSLTTSTAPNGTAVDSRSTLRTDSPTPLLLPGGGRPSGTSDSNRSGSPENPYRRTLNFSRRAGRTRSCSTSVARASLEAPPSPNSMLREVSTSTATAFSRFFNDCTARAGCQSRARTKATERHCKATTAQRAGAVRRLRARSAYQAMPAPQRAAARGSSQAGQPAANSSSPFW